MEWRSTNKARIRMPEAKAIGNTPPIVSDKFWVLATAEIVANKSKAV